ncbi:MAG: tyrosine-type recombinase/integrase [Acidobacteriaceae bacterium]
MNINGIQEIELGNVVASDLKLHTLADLLRRIEWETQDKPIAMFKSTANRLADFFDKSVEQIPIEVLSSSQESFREHLRMRRFKPNTIRSYVNYGRIMLQIAVKMGWSPTESPLEKEWSSVLLHIPKRIGAPKLARFAVEHGISPSMMSDTVLEQYAESVVRGGRSFNHINASLSRFRRSVTTSELASRFPLFLPRPEPKPQYSIRTRAMPSTLQEEVHALLRWKQAPYAPGRPRRSKLRGISAEHLRYTIECLYGFVTTVRNQSLAGQNLTQLATEENVNAFVEWSLNERMVKHTPFMTRLAMLCAAMKRCPSYKAYNFDWFTTLLRDIPLDPDSVVVERKARKYLPYDEVAEIPERILCDKIQSGKRGPVEVALLYRDALLLKWLATLPWRQRNLRECRIGENIYKGGILPYVYVAQPNWVSDELARNPAAEFWQFAFRDIQTKTNHAVRGFLPRELADLLELYLVHRKVLSSEGQYKGYLFLARSGKQLTAKQVTNIVSSTTLRHAGRRVTPHIFRDIFAYQWLDEHPEDYLTLSKILWHRNINTTIRIYGRNFDESNGAKRVDEWLQQRHDRSVK